MPVFEIYDDNTSRCVKIDSKRITIGRTADNGVVIEDSHSSRHHCEVRFTEIGYILRDLNSRNGTMLNDSIMDRPMPLRDGDEICIGKATIRFWSNPAKMTEAASKLPLIDRTAQIKSLVQQAKEQRKMQQTAVTPAPTDKPPVMKQPKRAPAVPPHPPIPLAEEPAEIPHPEKPKEKKHLLSRKPAISPSKPVPPKPAEPVTDEQGWQIIADPTVTPEAMAARIRLTGTQELTVNHIIPLNHENRPAHPVGDGAEEVSQAMLRLKQLLLKCFQYQATDIHIEPKEDQLYMRYRIDGYLHRIGAMDAATAKSVYSIVKLLCNLDINKKNAMLDGSFAIQLPDRRVDLRVSIAPTTMGDKMVIRVLDKNLAPQGLDSLGMEQYILEQVREKAHQESSMMVVCGPTGSGKTTTVYAILQEMNSAEKNIMTVEDPVEYKLENVTQIQVNPRFNVTFASALVSLLRQDPDVLLVGEIRDADTAQMAMQSAMTGHLVLSTLHARDSIGAIFRLLDLGVEPFLLGSALSTVLSQRLMRKLCDRCKMKIMPAVKDLSRMGLESIAGTDIFAAVGCSKCMNIGYRGRCAVFELLSLNDQVRDAIAHRPTIQQLRVAAGDWIFQTLREDAIRKLRAGISSLDEYKAIAGPER